MARYDIKIPSDPHWDAMWDAIRQKEGHIPHPYNVDGFLLKYKGKTYDDPKYTELRVYGGIEFQTEEDLLFFKLIF